MSQSDYIRYKRIANELKEQQKLEQVIDSGKYAGYKAFTVGNTITNEKQTFAKLQPVNSVNIFGIEINKQNSEYKCLKLFELRPEPNIYRENRKKLMEMQINSKPIPKKIDKFPHKTPEDLKMCKCV